MPYRYKCATCDQWHEGFPDMGYDGPVYATQVPAAERAKRVFLTTDICVVDDADFFIRGLLELPVIGTEESFSWAVWSSLSKANFMRYSSTTTRICRIGSQCLAGSRTASPTTPIR